ncbi:MAG: response regulator [Candidatus Dormibacteria bacterium]
MSDEVPQSEAPGSIAQRSLLTVLFTDIVGSTRRAEELGDRRWGELLAAHFGAVRAAVTACGGHEVRTLGDGMMVIFRSPGDGIRCGLRMVREAAALGLELRIGLHTGEMEQARDDLVGLGVHLGARIAALAEPGEVLVSSTVRDLVQGGEYSFRSRGSHALKGLKGRQRLFAAMPAPHRQAADGVAAIARPALPRVLLVDDHPLWRQTLRSILETSRRAEVVGEAGGGQEAIEMARDLSPDLVLMDIDLPQLSGIEATRQIVALRPTTRVLMLSSMSDDSAVLQAVRAGASGYLLKTAGAAEVLASIRRIGEGEVTFPPALATVVLRALRGDPGESDTLEQLSRREREVLELMAQGLTNAAIATLLHVGAKTVETHVATIFSKLGIDGVDQHRRVMAVLAFTRDRSPRGSG